MLTHLRTVSFKPNTHFGKTITREIKRKSHFTYDDRTLLNYPGATVTFVDPVGRETTGKVGIISDDPDLNMDMLEIIPDQKATGPLNWLKRKIIHSSDWVLSGSGNFFVHINPEMAQN